jgi:hypothetical protein
MDLYPNLRAMFKEEFGGPNEFARQSGIPESTIKRFLVGDFGPGAEVNTRDRIECAILRLRPGFFQEDLWLRRAPPAMQSEVREVGGRKLKIVTTVTQFIQDLGPAGQNTGKENDDGGGKGQDEGGA